MRDDDILNPVQGDGRYAASLPFFGGLSIWEANPKIVAKLREVGALFHEEPLRPQLHALLAPQDAGHLSRDDAMVRRDGRRAGLARRGSRTETLRATALRGHRGDGVLSRRGARRGCTA